MCWTSPLAAPQPGCGSGWSGLRSPATRARLPERSRAARRRSPQPPPTTDGRIASLGPDVIASGTYRLIFDTGGYLARLRGYGGVHRRYVQDAAFFPEVTVTFAVS